MDDVVNPDAPLHGVKLRGVPALQGAVWVKYGLRAFFRQPLGFAGLYGAVVFAGMLLISIPVVGTIAAVTFTPSLTLAFMRAVQYTLLGRRFGVSVLIEAWRASPQRRRAQLKLGLLYCTAVASILVMLMMLTSPPPEWKAVIDSSEAARETMLQDPELLQTLLLSMFKTMLLSLLAYVPVSIAFWHAPALVQWAGQPIGKALFFSTMACWHNRWAFAVFGLTWGGVVLLAASAATLMASAFQSPQALQLVVLPFTILFGASFYASIYFSVVDCFEQPAAAQPAAD